jgi:hypothetical protein
MGCDYYTVKCLVIKYSKVNIKKDLNIEIILDQSCGYYWFDYDDDEPDYEEKYTQYKKDILNCIMKPIILYENGHFTNSVVENKYKDILNQYFQNSLINIIQITKEEYKYERS